MAEKPAEKSKKKKKEKTTDSKLKVIPVQESLENSLQEKISTLNGIISEQRKKIEDYEFKDSYSTQTLKESEEKLQRAEEFRQDFSDLKEKLANKEKEFSIEKKELQKQI